MTGLLAETAELNNIVEDVPSNDAPPKRGRGRPPGSKNRTATIEAPASTASGRSAGRRGSRAWVREQCAGLVGLSNLGLLFVSRDDALDEREMGMLSDALTAEAMSSERILKWLGTASRITPHVLMIQCAVAIAVPRLQRRGILPHAELTAEQIAAMTPEQRAEYDRIMGYAGAHGAPTSGSAGIGDSADAPLPMDAGTAPSDNGRYWQR